MRFEAQELANVEPVWLGSCEADPDDPWRARLPEAAAGAACRLELEPEEEIDCSAVTPPRVRISHEGEAVPTDEVFARIPSASPALVDLEADFVEEPPARYRWQLGQGGVFQDLGTSRHLMDQVLRCDDGSVCVVRFTVSDSCGRRGAEVALLFEP
jgi:hypothetical protein